MSRAQTCRYKVHIAGVMIDSDTKLRVDINTETGPLPQSITFWRHATKWDEALELVKKHAARQVPFAFRVSCETACWDLLPPCLEFTKFSAIDTLSITHYPHLTHIDVMALPFLRRFHWYPIENNLSWVDEKEYTLTSVRITGLTQCKYLEDLYLQGMICRPFILKLKAPFRNLQALEELSVDFNCANQRYPLELVASRSLCEFAYNGRPMLRYFKALRSIVKCVCVVIHRQQHQHKDVSALARALVQGPIHDPSLIVDAAFVIRRTHDEMDIPHATIDAVMKPL